MRKSSALILIVAALGSGIVNAQTTPANAPPRTVTALQPGLLEVTGPRENESAAAGIQKISATPGKGAREGWRVLVCQDHLRQELALPPVWEVNAQRGVDQVVDRRSFVALKKRVDRPFVDPSLDVRR